MTDPFPPQTTVEFPIAAYKKPRNPRELMKTHVAFSGAPKKHPLDRNKVILVVDPFSASPFYYEFDSKDIGYAEELPNLVNAMGESVFMTRIWVEKGSLALRCLPFLVEDLRNRTD